MSKITKTHRIGLIFFLSTLCIISTHEFIGDTFLFQSDLYSLSVYLGALALIPTIFLTPLVIFSHKLKHWDIITRNIIGFILAFFISNNLIFLATQYTYLKTAIFYFILCIGGIKLFLYLRRKLPPSYALLSACIATLILMLAIEIAYILSSEAIGNTLIILIYTLLLFIITHSTLIHNEDIFQKLYKIGRYSFVIIWAIPIAMGFNHIQRNIHDSNTETEKHLVIISLDALPLELLHSYNPTTEKTSLDDILPNASIYKNAYTSSPYTYGFFGTFFSGMICSDESPCKTKNNLIGELQNHNVDVQNITWNRVSTPEGSAVHSNHYKGLRSYLITEETTTWFDILGLNYHILLDANGAPTPGALLNYILPHHIHNRPPPHARDMHEFYVNQINRNINRSKQSLTIISTLWSHFLTHDLQALPSLRPYTQDWQYDEAKLQDAILDLQHKSKAYLNVLGNHLHIILKALDPHIRAGHTKVILMSDHGQMMSHGRLDYRWHPQEGAIRTALWVFDKMPPKHNLEDYINVININQSIKKYFLLNEHAPSFIDHTIDNPYVTTLTNSSDHHDEWFLIISGLLGIKYQVNIHPMGNGSIQQIALQGFDESQQITLTHAPDELKRIIHHALKEEFRLSSKQVHHEFQW